MTKNCKIPHVFAMDNLDWKKKKTLEGGSFNATTVIIVENRETERVQEGVRFSYSTSDRKTLTAVAHQPAPVCHISATDRQRSRSLEHIEKLESLMTSSDNTAEDLLLVWRLARMVITSQLLLDNRAGTEARLPGFSAFCADLHPHRQGSIIGYILSLQHFRLIRLSWKKMENQFQFHQHSQPGLHR